MKFKKAFIASCIFLIFLLLIYYIHIKYFQVNVVFYSAMLDGIFSIVLVSIGLMLMRYFDVFNTFEKVQMITIWLLVAYTLAISIPTVLDRSLSFYILEKLQQRGGGIRLESFEKVFSHEYLKEHRLIDVRLTEQQISGTILIEAGCVKLTPRGESLASFSRYFRQNYLPTKRLLMGVYSNDLTDPFRHSNINMGYECR